MSCIFFNQFILHKKDTPPPSQKLINLEETFEEGGAVHEFSKEFDALEEKIQIWNYLYDMEVMENWNGDMKHIEWGPTSTRSDRATASGYTGPKDAHTGDYFLYTEGSTFRPSMGVSPTSGYGYGKLYKLQSDIFKIDNSSENLDLSHFTFYYHMYGSHISRKQDGEGGHLCVKILKDNGQGGGELSPECVFLKESQQQTSMSKAWKEGTVPLNNNIKTYEEEDEETPFVVDGKDFLTWVGQSSIRIIISVRTGRGYRNDIAIDSLGLENIEHDGKTSDNRWLQPGTTYEKVEDDEGGYASPPDLAI